MNDPPERRAVLHQAERVDRIAERLDNQAERTNDGFDRINARLDGIMREIAAGRSETATIVREITEVKLDIGELRDRTAKVELATQDAAKASRDSASTAVMAAVVSSAETKAAAAHSVNIAVKKFWDTTTGKVVKWSAGVAGVGAAIGVLPAIAKFIERAAMAFWDLLKGG